MAQLRLIRSNPIIDCRFGILLIDTFFLCHTLENKMKEIPAGVYGIQFYASPKNKVTVPLLKDVPGRSEIEIHIANWPIELEGCIAVGTARTDKQVISSSDAFRSLMTRLDRNTFHTIAVENP